MQVALILLCIRDIYIYIFFNFTRFTFLREGTALYAVALKAPFFVTATDADIILAIFTLFRTNYGTQYMTYNVLQCLVVQKKHLHEGLASGKLTCPKKWRLESSLWMGMVASTARFLI